MRELIVNGLGGMGPTAREARLAASARAAAKRIRSRPADAPRGEAKGIRRRWAASTIRPHQ